jgi:hypothetical protein
VALRLPAQLGEAALIAGGRVDRVELEAAKRSRPAMIAEQPAGDAPLVRLDAGVVELDRAQAFVADSADILALLFSLRARNSAALI